MTNKLILTSFDLKLPDGRAADQLDRFELARELIALGVAGVDSSIGKQDSLALYAAHLETIKQTAVQTYSAQAAANDFAATFKGDAA